MFICRDCGRSFERPIPNTHYNGAIDPEDLICPFCFSTDYTEADKCPKCGKWYDWTRCRHDFCPDCYGEMAGTLNDLLEGLNEDARACMVRECEEWLKEHW